MRLLVVIFTIAVLLFPLTVGANHTVTRVCMDALDPTVVSVNLQFRTTITGTVTTKNVPVASLTSDTVRCMSPSVGVLIGSLGLPDSTTYFVKATAVDTGGHESTLSAEATGTPFPLDSTLPPGVVGLTVKP